MSAVCSYIAASACLLLYGGAPSKGEKTDERDRESEREGERERVSSPASRLVRRVRASYADVFFSWSVQPILTNCQTRLFARVYSMLLCAGRCRD